MTGDRNTKKGFTLIELLVSVFIFSLIIGGVVNALLTSIRLQQRILADQKMLAETSFALEYMGRTLRMARKDINGSCTGSRNFNYILLDGNRTIRFLNFDRECHEFSLVASSVSERIANTANSADLPGGATPVYLPITSSNVTVTSMVFGSAGSDWSSPATNQSKIVIGIRVRPRIGDSEISFQTVTSQRKLNVVY